MNHEISRRRFIVGSSAGTALLTMPGFLAGCSSSGSRNVGATDPLPDDPFNDWFGVDSAMARRVIAELDAKGATHADLYFQHTRSNSIRLEDGIVSQANSNIDQGVGLRTVVGDQVGYAFTEDLTREVDDRRRADRLPPSPSRLLRHAAPGRST